jgi:hypothetical protein
MPSSSEQTIGSAVKPVGDRARKPFGFNPEHSDIYLAAAYLIIFSIYFLLQRNPYGYDEMHGVSFLVGSARILDGQVPFRDFFPWYGPLFSYFMTFWTWLLGRDLRAVGIFMHVITPGLCLIALLCVTRWVQLDWPRRLMVVSLSLIFGVDRLFGATRTFLGLFLIGLWFAAIRLPQHHRPWARAAVFPSLLIMYFYSPEIGLTMTGVATVFMVMDLAALPAWRERTRTALGYGASIAVTLTVFFLLWRQTGWVQNYLRFSFYSSENMAWAYSSPFPAPDEVWTRPVAMFFYLDPILLAGAAGWLLSKLWTRQFSQIPPAFPVLLAYGAALWPSTVFKCDLYHHLFALTPNLILFAYFGLEPAPSFRKRWLLYLAAAALFVFINRSDFWNNWDEFRDQTEIRNSTSPFSGIYVLPEIAEQIQATKAFCAAHPQDKILFPLNTFEAYAAGRPFLWSFDDPFWSNDPVRQRLRMQQFRQLDPPYLALWPDNMFYIYTSEDTDPLFDYITANYSPLPEAGSTPRPDGGVIFYQRRSSPAVPVRQIQELPGPYLLSAENNFSITWELPPGFTHGYLEMQEKFFYRPTVSQRLSKPSIAVYVTEQGLRMRLSRGRQAIRNTPAGGVYRLYLPPNINRAVMTISFPGMFNPAPERVEISGIKFQQFNFAPRVPYTRTFLERGY